MCRIIHRLGHKINKILQQIYTFFKDGYERDNSDSVEVLLSYGVVQVFVGTHVWVVLFVDSILIHILPFWLYMFFSKPIWSYENSIIGALLFCCHSMMLCF